MKSLDKDLTTGKPSGIIFRFMIPILLSNLLQQFYSIVDTSIVGQFLGKDALAGVGSTGSINFLIIGLCIGISTGFTILIAQRYGARDYQGMRKFMTNGIWAGGLASIIITIAVAFLCRSILEVMDTPANIIDYAYNYIFVIFLGIPITIAYNFFAGIIRSLGDSKTPFIFLLMASVINVGFDFLSVTVLDMGVAGPAIATVLSQLFSVVMCIIVIIRRFDILKPERNEWRINLKYVGRLYGIGLPFGLQYSITAIGAVLLQSGLNTLGSDTIAAFSAAIKINNFLGCPGESIGSAMATFAGQNLGAEKPDRIHSGLWAAMRIGIIYSVVVFVIILFVGKYTMLIFIDPSETEIIAKGAKLLTICSSSYILLMAVNIFRFTIQGMGYSMLALFAGVLEMIARSVLGIFMVPVFGFTAVCFANPAAWICADIFLVPAFYVILNRVRNKIENRPRRKALKH